MIRAQSALTSPRLVDGSPVSTAVSASRGSRDLLSTFSSPPTVARRIAIDFPIASPPHLDSAQSASPEFTGGHVRTAQVTEIWVQGR